MSDPELPEAARAFVDGDVTLLPSALSAQEGDALVALLQARGDVVRLLRLGEGNDKALAKKARRALHLLRARGVTAPTEKREFRPAGPYAVEELSLASAIDGRGERIVWLARAGQEGIDIFEAQLSETRGIIGFTAAHTSRKEWRRHLERVSDDERLAVGRISEQHARALIEAGYQCTLAVGRTPPEEFARAKLSLGHYEPEAQHPALAVAPPLSLDGGSRDASGEVVPGGRPIALELRGQLASLLDLPELQMWIPPQEILPELDLAIGNIVTSKLVIDPAQRREQLAEAIDQLADRTLTPEYRRLLAERLRETAYLLHQRGKPDAARLATTAALVTDDESIPGRGNPFLVRLINKVVRAPESA
jgi:hypothetical protein